MVLLEVVLIVGHLVLLVLLLFFLWLSVGSDNNIKSWFVVTSVIPDESNSCSQCALAHCTCAVGESLVNEGDDLFSADTFV